jgi:hypothetical protein
LIERIVNVLYKIIEADKTKPKPLELDQVRWWWIFKDRAVKLHGSFELIKNWYQHELLSIDRIELSTVKIYIDKISKLFIEIDNLSAITLYSIVNEISNIYPQLLSEYVKVTIREGRSNWIGMPQLSDAKRGLDIRMLIEKWVVPDEEYGDTYYNQINYYLSRLEEISDAIEDGVDWVHEDCFSRKL